MLIPLSVYLIKFPKPRSIIYPQVKLELSFTK